VRNPLVAWLGVLFLGSTAAFAGTAPDPPARAHRIPARVLGACFLVVPVSVNGTGPYPFVLDTASSVSIVDERLARALDLPVLGPAVQETPTTARPAEVVQATLTLGQVQRTGGVLRGPLQAVKEVDAGIRGLLGQDVLQLANWWVDYRGARLVADPEGTLAVADLGERLPLIGPRGRPAIEVTLPSRRRLTMVLDSGASSAVLFRDLPDAIAQPASARLATTGEAALVPVSALGPLRAGRAVIPRLSAAVVASAASARLEDGLLPTGLFEGLYLDNRGGTVVLDPRRSALAAVR